MVTEVLVPLERALGVPELMGTNLLSPTSIWSTNKNYTIPGQLKGHTKLTVLHLHPPHNGQARIVRVKSPKQKAQN